MKNTTHTVPKILGSSIVLGLLIGFFILGCSPASTIDADLHQLEQKTNELLSAFERNDEAAVTRINKDIEGINARLNSASSTMSPQQSQRFFQIGLKSAGANLGDFMKDVGTGLGDIFSGMSEGLKNLGEGLEAGLNSEPKP